MYFLFTSDAVHKKKYTMLHFGSIFEGGVVRRIRKELGWKSKSKKVGLPELSRESESNRYANSNIPALKSD